MPPKNKSKKKFVIATRNPCNQFLVQHLIHARSKLGSGHFKERKDHRFFMYSTAIQSIRKYPLPIICEDQLRMLVGIGDYLTQELIEVIKHHYRKYLKHGKVDQLQEEEKKEKNESSQNLYSQAYNSCSQGFTQINQKALSEGVCELYSEEELQSRDNIAPFLGGKLQTEQSCNLSQQSSSVKSLTVNGYKPRQGTQASIILRVLKECNGYVESISRKNLGKLCTEKGYDKIKQWGSCKQILVKNEYIVIDPSASSESFLLTEKGLAYAQQLQEKQANNISKKKLQQQIKLFKQQHLLKEEEQIQSQSNSNVCTFSRRGGFCHAEESQAMSTKGQSRQKLEISEQNKLVLIIDTREMKDHTQKSFFQEKLVEKYRVEVQTAALTIGDFVFTYGGSVLDFVIERKKADDLASSIIDGRYKDQKYRLKNCGASNVIYLYEGHPSSSCPKTQKQLNNALNKTRIVDGFVIYKTKTINQTAKLLAGLQSELTKKINIGEELIGIGTLEEFNRRNSKSRMLTIEQIFGLGLKTFPNVGKQTVTNLLRYFKSFKHLYDKLKQLESDEQRVDFLNGLLKGGRTQAGVTKLIVSCLFRV